MQHTIESTKTSDGLTLHTEHWLPDDEPKAVILIAHGYGEHIGRYTHVAAKLVEVGYAVYGLDHRGHGQSEGLQAHFKAIDEPVNDLHQYFQHIKAKHPDQKYFFIGHSMGTLIGLTFLLRHQDDFTGAVLSGTAINADETVAAPMRGLANLLANIIPTVPLIPALGPEALSTDTTVVQAYDADPLVYRGSWRVGMGALLIQTGQKLRAQIHQLRLPLLILHGSDDAIAPVSGARTLHTSASSEDKVLYVYDGMLHEVFNEREKERVLDDMISWLNTH